MNEEDNKKSTNSLEECLALEIIRVEFDLQEVKLTSEQRIEYNRINDSRAKINKTKLRAILKTTPLTEKQFYLSLLREQQENIYLKKMYIICEEEGHLKPDPDTWKPRGNTKMYNCPRCHKYYFKHYTQEELQEQNRLSRIPMMTNSYM